MKIKCIKLINENTGEEEKLSSWVTLNKIYDVLCLVVYKKRNITQVRIISDDSGIPALFNLNSFEIIDSRMPPNWEIFYDEDNLLELSPKSWMENGFWERFFDYDKRAIQIFEKERKVILEKDPS